MDAFFMSEATVATAKQLRLSFLKLLRIDKLQPYGINAADITKFKNAGHCTVLR